MLESCRHAGVGRILGVALLGVLLGACGGSGGPDTGEAQQKLLASVNLGAEGKAKFAEFKETGRTLEGEGEFQGCVVEFEGQIEFTGDCEYEMQPRKAGDRVPFEASVEYVKDQEGWKPISMGLYPK